MKKIFAALLTMSLVFFSCGGNQPSKNTTPDKTEAKPAAAPVEYKDGQYKVVFSAYDSHGWKPELVVQVRGGKVVSANYDYTNKEGKLKSADKSYAEFMKKKVGIDQNEASTKLIERLQERNAADIDAVAGATSTSNFFKAAAKVALEKAAIGDSRETVLPMNDTYTAEDKDFDERGWKGSISITFKDEKIEKVTYVERNKDGKEKKDDVGYNTSMKEKAKISWNEAIEKLTKSLIEKQSTEKLDAVAGATGTSGRVKTLATQALSVR